MKRFIQIIGLSIVLISLYACGKDNYDPPESVLEGKITYNGELIGLKGTGESVQLQLYEEGWQKNSPIAVFVNQDGTFNAKLFNGTYKLTTRNNNGPWLNSNDSIPVEVKGSTTCEIKVTPYFTISNAQITMDGSVAKATFTVNKIVDNAQIGEVLFALSNTQFVDETVNVASTTLTKGEAGDFELKIDVADNEKANTTYALYARVGVKATVADQAIYSEVVRLK